ncbi:MAG TPA: hypothetical protein VNW71_22405 [Thermoanaerobaculia bacterium]|nr:hypothetical protein [Thermoanaerobaculia bacterium]
MIELPLPSATLMEVPFVPNMPARKGGPRQVPPLEKRVLVGTPLTLPLNKKTVGKDPELLEFLNREKDTFKYHLVRLSMSLQPEDNESFQMVTLNVTLDCAAGNGSCQPIVWSMQPMHDMDVDMYTSTAKLSVDAKLLSAELGDSVVTEVKNEFITPFGLQTSTPYWVFTPTSARRISGAYQCKLIVRAPAAGPTQGEVTIDVSLERTAFMVFSYRSEYTKDTTFTLD